MNADDNLPARLAARNCECCGAPDVDVTTKTKRSSRSNRRDGRTYRYVAVVCEDCN